MLRHREAAKLFTGGGACRYIRRAWLNPESTNRPSHYGRCFGFMHDPSYYWEEAERVTRVPRSTGAQHYRGRAARFRELACAEPAVILRRRLIQMAIQFEEFADELEAKTADNYVSDARTPPASPEPVAKETQISTLAILGAPGTIRTFDGHRA
jgi:hypothetical protein